MCGETGEADGVLSGGPASEQLSEMKTRQTGLFAVSGEFRAMDRRSLLRAGAGLAAAGLAGCLGALAGTGDADSDGDGVPDDEDYAPRDPDVQSKSDLEGTTRPPARTVRTPVATPTTAPPTEATVPAGDDSPTPVDGVAAFYDFEESGVRLVDRTGNGHGGRLHGAARHTGRSGTVLDVDHGTYATIGSADTLVPGDDGYTTALWFRTTTIPDENDSARQGLAIKRAGSRTARWHFALHGDRVQLDVRGSDGDAQVRSEGGYVDGHWHHTVGVRDDDGLALYVDGELRDTREASLGTVDPASPLFLGAQPEYPRPLYYEGQFDDVAVFPRALSAGEVRTLYRG